VPAHLDSASSAERLTGLLEIPVSARATELFAASSVADTPEAAPDAAAAFGVATTPFEDGLRAVAASVLKGG
jgi:hypothetical protein